MKKKITGNKSLLVAAILSTISLTGISSTPTLAAETPFASYSVSGAAGQDYKAWWGIDEFKHRCLTIDNATYTKIKDVKEDEGKKSPLDGNYSYTNTSNETETRKLPTYKNTVTKSITFTDAKEFSFGQEISAETGELTSLIAKASAKLSFGQKITTTTQNLDLETKEIQYGGDELTVKPGERIDVTYRLTRPKYTGTLETANPIHYNIGQKINLRGVTNDEVNQMSSARNTNVVKTDYWYSSDFKTDYEFFKHMIEHPGGAAVEINYHREGKNDVYIMSANTIQNAFFVDDKKQQVYLKQSQANFELDGDSSKVEMIVTKTNTKTNKIVSQKAQPVPYF
ncbi:hypothetical protein P4278_09970 [Bacillus thuringiensis]|nr:hypothetical protein [Bacillus thuringiensis]MED2760438.1 hypothetical protein [Bacillus thuringiensis]MED2771744.1 hypothetical protein [Bacillus thuringiensis]MED2778010.1 hypothetical protein [Bacillus thuringiensis]MED2780029.1 hypothetical protein [Bacillus thuringiensis]